MKPLNIPFKIAIFVAITATATAADPTWWANRSVIITAPESNLSPATIGQAKWMVKQAMAELELKLDAPVFQGLKNDIEAVANLNFPQGSEQMATQLKVLSIGQLKALAAPFYIRLHFGYRIWLESELTQNLTKDPSDITNYYPWTTSVIDDSNLGVASIGQLKAVFALRFETLPSSPSYEDNDGMNDAWELLNGFDPANPNDANRDYDHDGATNLVEYGAGTDPRDRDTDNDLLPDGWEIHYSILPLSSSGVNGANGNPDGDSYVNLAEYVFGFDPQVSNGSGTLDTDGDGHPDDQDYFPLDPFFWLPPTGSGISGPPVITLLSPPGAALQP